MEHKVSSIKLFPAPYINLFQYDTLAEKNKADKNKATVAEIYPWIKEEVRYELYDDYLVIRKYSRLIFFENNCLLINLICEKTLLEEIIKTFKH